MRPAGEQFNRLLALLARLRSPEGCPWDLEQTFDSIKPYTLEETYEVLDAIDARDWPGLAEELGDFILQAVFYAQMAEEAGLFRIEDSLEAINGKLIRRHPHIFAEGDAKTSEDVKRNWDRIKADEKRGAGEQLLLETVPRSQPALMEATQLSARAAKTGFDWPDADAVLRKVDEELQEFADARRRGALEEMEGEIGDVLFALVNVARVLRIDPEQALRKSNAKFRHRFGYVERSIRTTGRTLDQSTLDEMEGLWQDAKAVERGA